MANEANVTYTVEGVTAAIKTLRKMDKELAKEYRGLMRAAAAPLQAEARSLVPVQAPLTNWGQWKGGWSNKVRTGIRTKINTGGKKYRVGVIEVQQTNAAGAIFDMAGRAFPNGRGTEGAARGAEMVARLNRHFGRGSRSMWPAAEKELPKVISQVEKVVDQMSKTLNQELKA
jgi:HK97 gp10 family phage protein